MKRRWFYFFLSGLLVIADQVSKYAVQKSISPGDPKVIIRGLLEFQYVTNNGAIFGLFNQAESGLVFVLLTIGSILAMGFVVFYIFKSPPSDKLLNISLSLILAGALGNILDRLIRGFVIDFVKINIRSFTWPNFNVADSCISIGAVLLIYIFLFRKSLKCTQS
jgi:signal peptidase II